MKYKYDSRKNCASQMKREQFFSVSHFAIPLPTVNCQLSTVPWIHTFSAKEKDSETGISYFGSRYYSSDLSIWLSVDPMSDKYPSLSPYVYCANNPIKLVDPNGEEVYIFGKNRHRNTIVRSLNKHFENITIGYNKKSGKKKKKKGTALTNDEIALADAISDNKIEVNIQLSKSSTLEYKNSKGETLEVEEAGAFMGNKIFYDGKGQKPENIRKVRTLQHISMKGLAEYYKKKDWGALVNHEITESFQGGVISSTENVPGTSEQGIINVDIYKRAHFAATRQPTPKKYIE